MKAQLMRVVLLAVVLSLPWNAATAQEESASPRAQFNQCVADLQAQARLRGFELFSKWTNEMEREDAGFIADLDEFSRVMGVWDQVRVFRVQRDEGKITATEATDGQAALWVGAVATLFDRDPRVAADRYGELRRGGLDFEHAFPQVINDNVDHQKLYESLQANEAHPPDDQALREKVIRLALTIDPPPAIPEEAERFLARGEAALESAKDAKELAEAAQEFEKAALIAPWVGNIYYNLAVVQDKAGVYPAAIRNLKLYLLATPDASDAKEVKALIYKIEFKQEKAVKDEAASKDSAAKEAAARAEEKRKQDAAAAANRAAEAARAAKAQNLAGSWRNTEGKVVLQVQGADGQFTGSIPDDGVWLASTLADGVTGKQDPSQERTTLTTFWTSGTVVHFTTMAHIKFKTDTYGPWVNVFTLTLSKDGTQLAGTLSVNAGAESPATLYRRD